MECVPGSTLPDELRAQLGYDVRDAASVGGLFHFRPDEPRFQVDDGHHPASERGSIMPIASTVTDDVVHALDRMKRRRAKRLVDSPNPKKNPPA